MIPRTRWAEIKSVFDQVADMGRAEQFAHLDKCCGGDAELRSSVQSLLILDGSNEDPLLQAVGAAAESLLEDHRDRLLGTRVGAYRVVSILGHGGMSIVYRGERDDAQYHQSVAIKVLQHATVHPRLRSRLHSERHILATLDHSSIARLIDSGDLDDGTPYLVMEYVDGESIDQYCDSRTLFIRERLELFISVCAAVHYAHRNLVVHRDIKASNIFVTGEGNPKLLDFGIAKLLAPENLSHTLPVTRLQERILTPENAAPEQVLGRPITTATDIYALGVLLYQLLTGRSPYRLLSYSQLQLERAICMDDPARPSQAVVAKLKDESETDRSRISDRRGLSPQRLRARLSGDLDAIVGMAMRKEPDRRYPSVEAFADDLRRHLLGQPVRARQGDWRYGAMKFLRRNLFIAVATAAAFVGLAIIAGVTLWENHRILIARDATALERDRAQQVSAFMVDVFSQADPFNAQGHEPTAKDLLDQGAEKIKGNLSLQPEVREQLLESIGLAYRRQGSADRAIPLFEQAVSIRREARPADNAKLAAALANLAQALTDAGRLPSAEANIKEAVAVAEAGRRPASSETADILFQYGNFLLVAKSDPLYASKLFTEALSIYRSAPGDQRLEIASTLGSLSSAAQWSGNFADAEPLLREAQNLLGATVGRNHPDYAEALGGLGYVLMQQGKYAEAEQTLNEALQIVRDDFGTDNARVAPIEANLGTLYEREGDAVRAMAMTREALKVTADRRGPRTYMAGYYLDAIAKLDLDAGNLGAAEATAREVLAIYAESLPPRHLYVAATRQLLGEVLLRRGQLVQAEAELRTALDIDLTAAGEGDWRAARAQASLGWLLIVRGNIAEGEPMLVAARAKLLATIGPQHPEVALTTSRLAQYYRSHHRDAEAARILAELKQAAASVLR
ncbi:MAG TPA: serine/threonine-protein kinase [Steroidobacteraceae bacterium]|jgi:serine/threonine protein kinase/tetratricopeptide (TPR) repeat protein|nr:serine/threonine-protein kinase [Steroidobacteraceae bacterium]